MKVRPLYSIIIPVSIDHTQIVQNLLLDLTLQDLSLQFEVILSLDRVFLDETEMKRRFPTLNLKFSHSTAGRPSITRNQAAELATGEVLIFIDADMRLETGSIQTLADTILNGSVSSIQPLIIDQGQCKSSLLSEAMNFLFIDSCFFAVKKSLFQKVNGFDSELRTMEDVDFSIKIFSHGGFFGCDPRLKVIKTDHRDFKGKLLRAIHFGKGQRVILERHHHKSFGRCYLAIKFFKKTYLSLFKDFYSAVTNFISSLDCFFFYTPKHDNPRDWKTHIITRPGELILVEKKSALMLTKIFPVPSVEEIYLLSFEDILLKFKLKTPTHYHIENQNAFHERRIRLWDKKEESRWNMK